MKGHKLLLALLTLTAISAASAGVMFASSGKPLVHYQRKAERWLLLHGYLNGPLSPWGRRVVFDMIEHPEFNHSDYRGCIEADLPKD